LVRSLAGVGAGTSAEVRIAGGAQGEQALWYTDIGEQVGALPPDEADEWWRIPARQRFLVMDGRNPAND